VLLGAGRRLFDEVHTGPVELRLTRRLTDRDVTHLHFEVG
jgi:hypothetical protein